MKMSISLTFCLILIASTLDAATLGYWGFNEGSGNLAADSSGNGHNFSLTPPSVSPPSNLFSPNTPPLFNGGTSFDGRARGINDGTGSLDTTSDTLTLEAWVNIAAPGPVLEGATGQMFPNILGKSSDSGVANAPYFLMLESRDSSGFSTDKWQIEYIFTDTDGSRSHNQNTGVFLQGSQLETWTHIAVTYDGSNAAANAIIKIYVDGVEQASITNHSIHNSVPTSDGVLRGNIRSGTGDVVLGSSDSRFLNTNAPFFIDEVRISDEALLPGSGSGLNELAFNANLSPVPEPSTLIFCALALLFASKRKKSIMG